MISQVTIIVWYIKNHFVILAMMSETTNNDVSELHAVIYEASDNADAEVQMKWSHMSKQQEFMRDKLADIDYHTEDNVTV